MEWAEARQTQPAKQSQVTQSEDLVVAADHSVWPEWKTIKWSEESLSPCHNITYMIKHMQMHVKVDILPLLILGISETQ